MGKKNRAQRAKTAQGQRNMRPHGRAVARKRSVTSFFPLRTIGWTLFLVCLLFLAVTRHVDTISLLLGLLSGFWLGIRYVGIVAVELQARIKALKKQQRG